MGLASAPNRPRANLPLVERGGLPTRPTLNMLDEIWRQVAAGYVIVPCSATGTNVIALTPIMNAEGASLYANYMPFSFVAANTSTGLVTASVGTLATLNVYKNGGASQATAGDIVAASLYLLIYNSALNAGAGGFVLK